MIQEIKRSGRLCTQAGPKVGLSAERNPHLFLPGPERRAGGLGEVNFRVHKHKKTALRVSRADCFLSPCLSFHKSLSTVNFSKYRLLNFASWVTRNVGENDVTRTLVSWKFKTEIINLFTCACDAFFKLDINFSLFLIQNFSHFNTLNR